MTLANKRGPAFDPAHAKYLERRVFPDGSGWVVTPAGLYMPLPRASHEYQAQANARLEWELKQSVKGKEG